MVRDPRLDLVYRLLLVEPRVMGLALLDLPALDKGRPIDVGRRHLGGVHEHTTAVLQLLGEICTRPLLHGKACRQLNLKILEAR